MVLALISVVLLMTLFSSLSANYTEISMPCPELDIFNGEVTLQTRGVPLIQIASIQCKPYFDLIGEDKMICTEGDWQTAPPICVERCDPPPFIANGGVEIVGNKASDGRFKKGALATYSCSPEFELIPSDSKYRVCEGREWTGVIGICVHVGKDGCKPPEPMKNGYYVHEHIEKTGAYGVGERLHYSCSNGYALVGPTTQTCLDDGSWSPKIAPKCVPSQLEGLPCPLLPVVHFAQAVPRRYSTVHGTEVEIRCTSTFLSLIIPCTKASKVKCVDGTWTGTFPDCGSRDCPSPPEVPHATAIDINDFSKPQHFLKNTQVSYQCYPGYELKGHEILTCSSGCWTPREPPICISVDEPYLDSGSSSSQILASLASGVCVLLLLVVVCLVVICRRRKPLSRAVSIQPSAPRPDLGDHAALLHPPDRLALIAFADGIQAAQPVLPTYEEAIRDSRGSGFVTTRIQRPHWPSLATRRSRNSPNPDSIHVTRQGSFASHSASLRSDPMGSTDTMAVSENSTTVTLETVSSHSGSQPASCRAHCGSLASFDTSSVLNTEGVPLLEENELEEVQGDSISLAMENRSMTDNCSFKLSIHSDIP